jgi:hypothetical protein
MEEAIVFLMNSVPVASPHENLHFDSRIETSCDFTHLYPNTRAVVPHTSNEEVPDEVDISLFDHIFRNKIEIGNQQC